ncbi:Gfo/Idh/MocA family protein [Demequina globuliformis]|uniref:Gfo/Idh/MocA family protein n=1 Tax=Demequina globuliformis TaxID=676202 RepID=UPI000B3166DF|nr:Gfo/Idh/MocA family oxidoreductase [Demequina globuliformis]
MTKNARVAMIGNGFMGAAHSQGWRVAPRFFDLPLRPQMAVMVGRNPDKNAQLAQAWGWEESSEDFAATIARDDIDIVDIVTPGNLHCDMAIAALEAGKHVLCEKPLANTVDEARRMAQAAHTAAQNGIYAMVGFTYRRVPAATFARDLVARGAVGTVRQVRAQYLQDWLADPQAPLTWRMDKSKAGSGALGDIGAHAVDLAQYITADSLATVSGTIETFVKERPVLGQGQGLSGSAGEGTGPVTVDDFAAFTGRFDSGAVGVFEATRFATGRKNALQVEVAGDKGSILFNLEDMNAVQYYDATAPATEQGFRRIYVTEADHPYMAAWWPPGHMLGYEHGFSHQAKDFIEAIASGEQPRPSFEDGYQVQRVLDAVERSSGAGSAWTSTAAA